MPETYYGKDCPIGMVQIEFVHCPPEARYSPYGWKPVPAADLEIYIDGQRFTILVGDFHDGVVQRRGLYVVGPGNLSCTLTSSNAVSVFAVPQGDKGREA